MGLEDRGAELPKHSIYVGTQSICLQTRESGLDEIDIGNAPNPKGRRDESVSCAIETVIVI